MALLDVDTDEYKAWAKRLKQADRAVANSLRKRLREAGRPLVDGMLRDGPNGLPTRGGLADWLRQAKGTLSVTQTRLQVRLSRGGKHDLAAINAGRLRHPVHGNRKAWALQEVAAGTYDAAIDVHAEAGMDQLGQVLDDVMEEI